MRMGGGTIAKGDDAHDAHDGSTSLFLPGDGSTPKY